MKLPIQAARDQHAATVAQAEADLAEDLREHRLKTHGLDLTSVADAKAAEREATVEQAAAEAALPSARRVAGRLFSLISKAPIVERNAAVRAYRAAQGEVNELRCAKWYWWNRGNVARYRASQFRKRK